MNYPSSNHDYPPRRKRASSQSTAGHRINSTPTFAILCGEEADNDCRTTLGKTYPGLRRTGSQGGGPILHGTPSTPTPSPLLKAIIRGRPVSKRLRRNPPSLVARKTQMRPTSKQWPYQIYLHRMSTQMHRGQTTIRNNTSNISSGNGGGTTSGHRSSTQGIFGIHSHHVNRSLLGTPQTLGIRPCHRLLGQHNTTMGADIPTQ